VSGPGDFFGAALFLKQFRDLNGVQGCTFKQLIAGDPEAQSVLEGAINAQSPDLAVVFSRDCQWHGIEIGGRFVDQFQSGRFRQDVPRGRD
jgi:hypothetical protein